MQITCAMSKTVHPLGPDGKRKAVVLRPGKHNYPELKPKNDPLLADELRVLRKHRHIVFDDLLPGDSDILKECPKGTDRAAFLAEKVTRAPSPRGRNVMRKGRKNVGGSAPKNQPASAPKADTGDGKKSGKVSDKK